MPPKQLIPYVKLDSKGRVLLPKIVRDAVALKEGDLMQVEVYANDKILLTMLGKS